MASKSNGEFSFSWNVSFEELLKLNVSFLSYVQSDTYVAANLKKTEWYLKIKLEDGYIPCYLYRNDSDESKTIFISVTFKLEVLDTDDKLLSSVVKNNIRFWKGECCAVYDLITADILDILTKDGKTEPKDTLTIRCTLIEDGYEKQITAFDFPTVIHSQWKIKSDSLLNGSKKIRAPLHQYAHIDIDVRYFWEEIFIHIKRVDLLQPYAIKIVVLNDNDHELDFKYSKNIFQSTDDNEDFKISFDEKQLVDSSSSLQKTYSFTVICSIHFSNSASEIESYSIRNSICQSNPDIQASSLPLEGDLKKLLLSEKFSDVKLRSHGKIIPAHKCLLSIRSPVFAAMFDQDMIETQTGIVDIPDADSKTLIAFLEFLYTDTITTTGCEDILALMLLADKYQVDILKDECSKILMDKVSKENVCEVLSVAEMVHQQNLKLFVIDFIKENKKYIIASKVWSVWVKKNMELGIEVLTKLSID